MPPHMPSMQPRKATRVLGRAAPCNKAQHRDGAEVSQPHIRIVAALQRLVAEVPASRQKCQLTFSGNASRRSMEMPAVVEWMAHTQGARPAAAGPLESRLSGWAGHASCTPTAPRTAQLRLPGGCAVEQRSAYCKLPQQSAARLNRPSVSPLPAVYCTHLTVS